MEINILGVGKMTNMMEMELLFLERVKYTKERWKKDRCVVTVNILLLMEMYIEDNLKII